MSLNVKRTVEQGHIRQNFSHGRSKSVLVETKRKRLPVPGLTEEPSRKPSPLQRNRSLAFFKSLPRISPAISASKRCYASSRLEKWTPGPAR